MWARQAGAALALASVLIPSPIGVSVGNSVANAAVVIDVQYEAAGIFSLFPNVPVENATVQNLPVAPSSSPCGRNDSRELCRHWRHVVFNETPTAMSWFIWQRVQWLNVGEKPTGEARCFPIVVDADDIHASRFGIGPAHGASAHIGPFDLLAMPQQTPSGPPQGASESCDENGRDCSKYAVVTFSKNSGALDVSSDRDLEGGWLFFGGIFGTGICILLYAALKDWRKDAFSSYKDGREDNQQE
jgi:hypothetical protein